VRNVAGEVAKGEKHLGTVEKVGYDFIPLIVESFGAWTPFDLKITLPHGVVSLVNLLKNLL